MDLEKEIEDPVSRFALSVFRIHGLLMRNGERITRSLGQSSAKWQVLGRAGHGRQSVAQMARDMGLARQSVQRVADTLEQAGLVAFQDSPADQRTFLVEITDEGRGVLSKIYEKNHAWALRLLQKAAPETLAEASAVLGRLALVLEELEKEEEGQQP